MDIIIDMSSGGIERSKNYTLGGDVLDKWILSRIQHLFSKWVSYHYFITILVIISKIVIGKFGIDFLFLLICKDNNFII